jgi:hypothetical protein
MSDFDRDDGSWIDWSMVFKGESDYARGIDSIPDDLDAGQIAGWTQGWMDANVRQPPHKRRYLR